MIVGYARVSSVSQEKFGNSLDDQVAALTAYGCDEIISEQFTGKTVDRPEFTKLLNRLQNGDTLVCTKLDRFARNTISGIETIQELFNRGVKVNILNMGMVEDTLTGRLILTVLLSFAEYERGMIIERCQSGRAQSRLDPNWKDGRPRKYTDAQLELGVNLLMQGKTYREVERMTGITRTTLYMAKKKMAASIEGEK